MTIVKKVLQISPSIAAGNLMNLASEVAKLELSGADSIHFDVMDGHFVPLLTIGVPFLEQIRKITKMHLDVHIMVTNPDQVFEHYLDAGADTLTFHIETALHAHRICNRIKEKGKRAGIALNPATHWREIEFLIPSLDQITLMSVNPGFSRQAHIPMVQKKAFEIRQYCNNLGIDMDIQLDGGVNTDNIAAIAQAGANIVVAGGAVFNYDDFGAAVSALRKAALAQG